MCRNYCLAATVGFHIRLSHFAGAAHTGAVLQIRLAGSKDDVHTVGFADQIVTAVPEGIVHIEELVVHIGIAAQSADYTAVVVHTVIVFQVCYKIRFVSYIGLNLGLTTVDQEVDKHRFEV